MRHRFFSADKTYSEVRREEAVVVRLLRTTALSVPRRQRAPDVLPLAQQADAAPAIVGSPLTAGDLVLDTTIARRVRRSYDLGEAEGEG